MQRDVILLTQTSRMNLLLFKCSLWNGNYSAVRPARRAQPGAAPAIVWLRQDLRLADNPALQAACRHGGPVVPVFVWAPEEEGAWPPGSASRWWLQQSLGQLAGEFRAAGAELVIRRGASLAELLRVAKATGAKAVFWNRRYEPAIIARDRKVEAALRAAGLQTESYNGALLHEPGTIRNKAGRPFRVFTPFWRTCLASGEPAEPLPAPRKLRLRPGGPRRCRWPRWSWSQARLGRGSARGLAAGRRRGRRAAAVPARRPLTTPTAATGPTSWAPRACRRTCILAKSAPGRSGRR